MPSRSLSRPFSSSAFRTHMDQDTVRTALGVLGANLSRAGVEDVTISGCQVAMESRSRCSD
jgi:hypothetical protein